MIACIICNINSSLLYYGNELKKYGIKANHLLNYNSNKIKLKWWNIIDLQSCAQYYNIYGIWIYSSFWRQLNHSKKNEIVSAKD